MKTRSIVIVLLVSFTLVSCAPQANIPGSSVEVQQLRITNSSDTDVTGLVVLFPGRAGNFEPSRIEFGNVPAGQTTEYKDVPGGVYRYAAYEYTLGDQFVSQFITDWVGESPVTGNKFTYQIVFDPNQVQGSQITLVKFLVDEP